MLEFKKLHSVALVCAIIALAGCEEVDPNALVMCPDFDPTKKYDKASDSKEHLLFDTCIPNDYGQPFYHELSEPLIVKLVDSRKFLQLKFSLLTKHDFMAQRRVAKHERALRAAFNERMLSISEDDINVQGFRGQLAEDLIKLANESIVKAEVDGFPEIVKDVLITSFIVE